MVSPRPSFRDMVTGRVMNGQQYNFISDLDVDLRYESMRMLWKCRQNVIRKDVLSIIVEPRVVEPLRSHPVTKDNTSHSLLQRARTRRSSAAVKALPQKDVKTNKKDELDDEQTVIMDLVLKFSNSLTKEGLTVASSSDGSDERPLMVRDGTI
ncbi:hypothetical protein V6N11_050271 [Hibiscus sabdariffa]|uniref:Uncharacterized protein n=1 Tax=Hibiscus sabdariffa TaxID=183260 RepID=A0ABR2T9B0_9ROSI